MLTSRALDIKYFLLLIAEERVFFTPPLEKSAEMTNAAMNMNM